MNVQNILPSASDVTITITAILSVRNFIRIGRIYVEVGNVVVKHSTIMSIKYFRQVISRVVVTLSV